MQFSSVFSHIAFSSARMGDSGRGSRSIAEFEGRAGGAIVF